MSDAVIIAPDGQFKRVPARVDNADHLVASASLILLVKSVGDKLERHYPGWRWQVKADEHGGVLDIFSELISPPIGNRQPAWTLHIARLQNDPRLERVLHAGGELLERYGFRRGPYSYEEWKRVKMRHGTFIPEVSDLDKHTQRAVNTAMIRQGLANGSIRIAVNPSIGEALKARAEGRL